MAGPSILTWALMAAAADAGALAPRAPVHVCVERRLGSRAAKTKPTYVTVQYGSTPPQEVGSVLSKELKCFEITASSFVVQLNSNSTSRADGDPSPDPESCGRVEVSGMQNGWLKLLLIGKSKSATGCPWTMTSQHGYGALPKLPPRPDGAEEKDFAVLPAVMTYAEARRVARTAARRLGLRLDPQRTDPRGDDYVRRGLEDDGSYVSIEDAITFFDAEDEGFVIILASGPKNDPSVRAVVEKARASSLRAEVRTDRVWQGCGH